ncbi:MAG: glycerol-3-phosphate 1-O-acyltransferase PlsY [Bacteroidales bacterium]|nr:glycerol-3-phosphate 1-O-acyltransferase PlsY [Bacteroidales bacterium]
MLKLLTMVLISYLAGSIPTAIIYGKLTRGIDIRQHGSGNAGATNVFRVLGWKAGVLVLLIDMAKGLVATLWIYKIASGGFLTDLELLKILAGLSAVFGHIWTVFAGFKGGKGVGTGAGMIIGLVPGTVLVAVIIFVLVVAMTRWVSLGSILASLTIPIYLIIKRFVLTLPVSNTLLIFGLLIPVLIIFTHRSNIKRLLNGTENKLVFKK